jgi:hypothetical protein
MCIIFLALFKYAPQKQHMLDMHLKTDIKLRFTLEAKLSIYHTTRILQSIATNSIWILMSCSEIIPSQGYILKLFKSDWWKIMWIDLAT